MRQTRTLLRIAVAACLIATGSSQNAHGQAAPAPVPTADASQSAELRKRGNEAMEAKRYADALALYQQAYSMSKDPALLYNQGRALESLGQFPEALTQLERFEAEAPPELKGRVPGLSQIIAEVRTHVAIVHVKSNVSGAQVHAQSKFVGTTPLPAALRLGAGRITLDVTAEGYEPYHREMDFAGGSILAIEANLLPKAASIAPSKETAPPVAPARSEGKAITSQWWFWTGAGVLVAGGAIAAALLIERPADRGDIPPGRVPVSLIRF
jgi:tetratricopeptide (TPR) repeat protein